MPIGLGVALGIGGGKPATSSGAPPPVSSFSNSYSVDVDGVDDYVNVGDVSADIYTAAFWFKPDSPISKSSSYSYPLSLNVWDGMSFGSITGSITNEIALVYAGGARSAYTSASASISAAWHHMAFTHNGTGYDIYLDGADVTTVTATQSVITASNVRIGTVTGSAGFFPGRIDEVALWGTAALSAAEIAAIYNSGTPTDLTEDSGDYTSSGDLVNYWRMGDNNGGTGTTATDQGSGSDDASLQNEASFVEDTP